jgi:homoserine dehydrogenase
MSVGIGIAGAGTVGGALVRRLMADRAVVTARTGLDLEVRRVVVRDLAKERSFSLPAGAVTADVMDLVTDDSVDLVVEVMGGLEPAGTLVLAALQAGKPVVTANKELIAARAPQLIAAAAASGVPLLFEAAVGGGIPIIRPLTETLAGEQISRVMGIVNGTTNFILGAMTERGWSFADALAEAQRLGFAESDPIADVSGADAVAKAAILAGLAFGVWVDPARVHREGIERLGADDLAAADRLGYVLKLLAIAERTPAGVVARVHPAMVPKEHPLAAIRGATNAIFLSGAAVGELLFAGPGAGGDPTATAVLGDVIDAARELLSGSQVAPRITFGAGEIAAFDEVETRWCLRLEVEDSPGVLARIAAVFGEAGVSLRSVWQDGRGDRATLLLVTHRAPERAHRAALGRLEALDVVAEVASTIRVEGDDS